MSRFTKITLDFNQAKPKADSTGYTRAVCKALANEGLVKFRESFIKKVIKTPLSANLQVTSYKPSEMDSNSNFFNAIANWSKASLKFQSWLHTHYVDTVFHIVEEEEVPDPNDSTKTIKRGKHHGDLFSVWHTLTLDAVYESCETLYKYSNDAIEAQNLNLSWEFIMANIDADLQAAVMAEISRFLPRNADVAQSGPMAFHVIAHRIIRSSDALAHNVITGVMGMGLIHFKGEDVIACVAVLRNVLLFLGHGTPRSKCPPTLMDTLYDVFLRCSNSTFVNYIRNIKDFHGTTIVTPEDLFKVAQNYYNDLLTKPNGWLRTTKNRAAFLASLPEMHYLIEQEAMLSGVGGPTGDKEVETDKKGNVIDRNPPKDGKTSRTHSKGHTEYWCAKCPKGGRWGNHDSSGHDDWYAKFKAKRAERKEKKKEAEAQASASGPTSGPNTTFVPSMQNNVCQVIRSSAPKGASLSSGYHSDSSY